MLTRAISGRIQKELDGSRVDVSNRARKRECVPVQGVAHFAVEVGRRSNLDHFLVSSLNGTVSLEQVNRVPRGIRENLDLDVAGTQHRLLDKHPRIAERALCFAHRGVQCVTHLVVRFHSTHSSTATAGDGLRENRITDGVGERD